MKQLGKEEMGDKKRKVKAGGTFLSRPDGPRSEVEALRLPKRWEFKFPFHSLKNKTFLSYTKEDMS